MWTEITRPQYLRKGLRYASDVTEAECPGSPFRDISTE
jgi:hypothetical protein